MEPNLWTGLAALLLLVAIMAASSAAHAAWPRLNRARLRHLSTDGLSGARRVLRLLEDPASPRATLTIVNSTSLAMVAGLSAILDSYYLAGDPVSFYAAAAGGVIAILWIQVAAYAMGSLYPESTVFLLLAPLVTVHFILRPLAASLRGLTHLVVPVNAQHPLDGSAQGDEDLRMIVDAVEEEGALEEEERDMIHGIFEMGETTVREIMVPRVDMVAVEAAEPLRTVLDFIKSRGHSRIPIYRETIDDIEGVVYAKDLLSHMETGSLDDPAHTLARPPHFVPEAKKTADLLREMQRDKVHMAVVLDEYGGTAGLVTIEDLLEEIVGEIQDEYDTEEKTVETLSENEAVFDARVSIHDMTEVLGVSLEDGEYDTVGGLVYNRLGKIPVVGDEVEVGGLRLSVLSVSGKRIKKVKIQVELDAAGHRSRVE